MEGRTHLLTAVTFYTALNTITGELGRINPVHLASAPNLALISIGAILAGSIMPDLDLPGSTAGSKVTLVNMRMVKFIVNTVLLLLGILTIIFSGNKYTLYGGSALLLFLLLSYKTVTNKLLYILRRVVQILIIAALATVYIFRGELPMLIIAAVLFCYFFSKHRGFSHTLTLSILSTLCVYEVFGYYGYPLYGYYAAAYFFTGCFLHIYINDYLTDKGVPGPLYPLTNIIRLPVFIKKYGFSSKAFKEGFKISKVKFFFTFSTGSSVEGIFSAVCTAAVVTCIVFLFKTYV